MSHTTIRRPRALRRKQRQRRCRSLQPEFLEPRRLLATLPPGFTEVAVATGLTQATTMELAPDGKLFIAEQAGTMEVYQNGTRLQANFFRDTPLTVNSAGERGLLGIAFDPNYATNRFVYVYYTATTPTLHNRVSRFTANAAGDLALAGSETVLLDLDNLSSATNHNGGAIHFGPLGKLFIAVGDNANGSNAQTLTNLHGKLLRINANGTIPSDNPFFGSTTGKNRAIWTRGLRNPYTFTFQPGTNRLFINDVGASTWEEINEGAAGANYGWPTAEGDFDPSTHPNFRRPFYAYSHSVGRAITGGAFYNPATAQFPADYVGDYFFADYVNGWIKRIDPATRTVTDFATGASNPVDLRVDASGNLYYLSRGQSRVFRVSADADPTEELRLDFGTATSPVAAGYTRVTPADRYTAALGYGWVTPPSVGSRDRGTGGDLNRDFALAERGLRLGFQADAAAGTYEVTLTMGDAHYAHPGMRVWIEGTQVDTVSTVRGQFVVRTYQAAVSDGRLTVELKAAAATDSVVLNALEVVAVTSGASASSPSSVSSVVQEPQPTSHAHVSRRLSWPDPLIGQRPEASESPARRLLQRARINRFAPR